MGFHRTVLRLKRAARFFFYCQNVVQIFPAIFGVVDQQSGIENVVSDEYIFFIDRKGKTDIIPIPTVFSIFTVFFFAVFFMEALLHVSAAGLFMRLERRRGVDDVGS